MKKRGPRLAIRLAGGALAFAMLSAQAPVSTLTISVDSLRSSKGLIRLCLTADPKNFPGCVDDAHALTRTVPAGAHEFTVDGLAHGDYAAAVIHDENSNAKLDTFMGIPREGFGFSRNPVIHFGPPKFTAAKFSIDGDSAHQDLKMRYLL